MSIQAITLITLALIGVYITTFTTMADGFRIGAFNIQIFGKKKAENPDVMNTIAKILRRYNIVLIQEIRDKSGEAIKKLLQEVNKYSGKKHKFEMIISDRLGRTNSKEQYAFFYRTAEGIKVVDSYHYDDGSEATKEDTFQREPFVVRFHIPQLVVKDIAMVAIHTDPGQAVAETKELARVIDDVMNTWKIDDVIVLGDLNADCSVFPKKAWKNLSLRTNSKYFWPIGDSVDTTTTNTDCAYDRFILTGSRLISSFVKNSAQVYHFDKAYGLDQEQAIAISDHYPIEIGLALDTGGTSVGGDSSDPGNCCSKGGTGLCSTLISAFVSCFARLLNVRN
ncbi:deoxyribonuclease-1-like isoform X2 [Liolophura sinensis]|uniref:deoxyribonuclease-1-like isoform X2 n=1 Tax=Liolophura sinensis TaxID=3198878 RepID=UPI00315949B7